MSELLGALIEQRRQEALDYQAYLQESVELTRDRLAVTSPRPRCSTGRGASTSAALTAAGVLRISGQTPRLA
jgi:hypothetical protein